MSFYLYFNIFVISTFLLKLNSTTMAIIDLVKWTPQGNKTIYAWRFQETNLSTYTQLIVQESQECRY